MLSFTKSLKRVLVKSQGQSLAVTVLYVTRLLESGDGCRMPPSCGAETLPARSVAAKVSRHLKPHPFRTLRERRARPLPGIPSHPKTHTRNPKHESPHPEPEARETYAVPHQTAGG